MLEERIEQKGWKLWLNFLNERGSSRVFSVLTLKHSLGFNFSEFVLTGWSRDTETGDPARLTAKVAERWGLKK
jgi:hypothetical protein